MYKSSLQKYVFNLILIAVTVSFNTSQANAEKPISAQKNQSNKELVSIQNAWVRPTNAGQVVGAAYMTFTSKQDITLVKIESDVTKSVEIHNMSMEGSVMKMRMLDTIVLSAKKPYILAPGGFHFMLFDLKKPLNIGDEVSFVLHFKPTSENAKYKKDTAEITQNIKVKVQTAPQAPKDEHDMKTMAK
ncbi:MAG: copper chaperone PCu(A)C [Bacteroidia bacterium]|nr:copper chaperone PCu(A)C [Methylotenera sp.]